VFKLVEVDRVVSPLGEMVLWRRKDEYSIRVRGIELMNSHNHGSEDELGKATCERLTGVAAPRVLIGGLGLGYTLRAALDHLPPQAAVEVVELVPDVVRWNRTVYGHLAGEPLADPRATVIEADVAEVIARSPERYDAIALDVDNGPDGLSQDNSQLYRRTGLAAIFRALAPGGICTIWSSFESPTFTKVLREVGFLTKLRRVKAKNHGGPRHYIWFAERRPNSSR
jgi:spermidine synthase